MEKFLYTNSNGDKALYNAEMLTEELYSNLLIQDEIYLNKIINKEIEEYASNPSFIEAAFSMKQNRTKIRNAQPSSTNNQKDLIMLIHDKVSLTNQPDSSIGFKSETPKQIIRKNLPTSKIRLFKREKMQYDI